MAWVRVLEYQLGSKHLACIEESSVLSMPASAENIITHLPGTCRALYTHFHVLHRPWICLARKEKYKGIATCDCPLARQALNVIVGGSYHICRNVAIKLYVYVLHT